MYVIFEIQTMDDGRVAVLTTQKETRKEAESTYYSILAAAALSDLPCHAAAMLTNQGTFIMSQQYMRDE